MRPSTRLALLTRPARVDAARAHVGAVDADLLWREWQVAQKARQLALDIHAGGRMIGLTQDQLRHLRSELSAVEKAIAAVNLGIGAALPLLTAVPASQQSLTALRLERLKNWQALDGLLGLVPTVRIVRIATEMAIFFISEYRALARTMPPRQVLVEAALNRRRPILMSTLAMIFALLPLGDALSRSGDQMLEPLAIAIIAGRDRPRRGGRRSGCRRLTSCFRPPRPGGRRPDGRRRRGSCRPPFRQA